MQLTNSRGIALSFSYTNSLRTDITLDLQGILMAYNLTMILSSEFRHTDFIYIKKKESLVL